MILLLFILPIISANIYPVNSDNVPEIPIVSGDTCPCAQNQNQHCRGGLYVDHYYNAPYSGYPANSTYLPPVDSMPLIIQRLKSIRDSVKQFVTDAEREKSPVKKAIYVKTNFSKVKHLLHDINKASKRKKE